MNLMKIEMAQRCGDHLQMLRDGGQSAACRILAELLR